MATGLATASLAVYVGVRYILKTFEVFYNRKTLNHRAVKIGFSWPAFIFTAGWAYLKRMYFLGTLVLLSLLILFSIEDAFAHQNSLKQYVFLISQVIIWILMGVFGNRMWKASLLRRGYSFQGTYKSDNSKGAIDASRNGNS